MLKHRLYYSTMLLHTELYVLFHKAPDYIGAHQIKHAHSFQFILFVSNGLGMCGRLNYLVCNLPFCTL